MKIFINGFGRIGRTIARIVLENNAASICGINDIVNDTQNLAYLLNYDSNYGRLSTPATVDGNTLNVGQHHIAVTSEESLENIDWDTIGADIIIDSSGVQKNVDAALKLRGSHGLKGVVVTHSPTTGIDKYIIMGVNEDTYDPDRDFVVSSSICDANAIAHPLKLIADKFGISAGSVTTMHPWLGYQNLTDAAVVGQSNPGHYWPDYSLGRSSVGALIPKNTTAVKALSSILPSLTEKLQSFSYRIPTSVVTSADLTLVTEQAVDIHALKQTIEAAYRGSPFVALNYESLISVDYEKSTYSTVIDMQWLSAGPGNMIKIVLWYDNEWGYACRALDTAAMVMQRNG